jgi:hypothetical protein
METSIITFNIKDIGRKFTGKSRKDFDTVAIADYINSPICQERVKAGDIQGYLEHEARFANDERFNHDFSNNNEYLDPAIVTVHLTATRNGDISHKQRLLNTKAGKIAQDLIDSKIGGFSTVFDGTMLKGFDYVTKPNNLHNRPYALDSVAMDGWTVDSVDGFESVLFLDYETLIERFNAKRISLDDVFHKTSYLASNYKDLIIDKQRHWLANEMISKNQLYIDYEKEKQRADRLSSEIASGRQYFDNALELQLLRDSKDFTDAVQHKKIKTPPINDHSEKEIKKLISPFNLKKLF